MDEPRVYENASVLFMDIVSYSKQTVEQQAKLISLLQTTVRQSREFASTDKKDLIALPTGDGMALVFTKNLVSPVQCVLEIDGTIRAGNELKVCMGIHTGPITRNIDIKGLDNVVSDGINIAQRVMDCSLRQKSWQAEARPTRRRKLLIQRGGAGAFACEPGGMGLLPQADSGDAGHILLSSTMADAVMRLSDDWSICLQDLGVHAAKQSVQVQL
jgi:hypothetical protein